MQQNFGTGQSRQESPVCAKCGQATRLLSFLPRFGETPAYYVFECITCKALAWVREAPATAVERGKKN